MLQYVLKISEVLIVQLNMEQLAIHSSLAFEGDPDGVERSVEARLTWKRKAM